MVVATETDIKQIMRFRQAAIGFEKRWIPRNSLVKQIDCLQNIRNARIRLHEIFAARVEIEGANVVGRLAFDGVLFAWREFGLQLVGDGLCDLALDGEYVREIAVINLPPDVPVAPRIDQLRVDAHPIAGALNASFH